MEQELKISFNVVKHEDGTLKESYSEDSEEIDTTDLIDKWLIPDIKYKVEITIKNI